MKYDSGQFRLKLFCNGEAVAYQIAEENKTSGVEATHEIIEDWSQFNSFLSSIF